MKLNIAQKMLAMGIAVLIGLLAMGLVINRIDANVEEAVNQNSLRIEQLEEINLVHEAQLNLMLAAMDSIIDKDEGRIDAERRQIINESADLILSKLSTIEKLADTAEEKQLASSLATNARKLVDGIKVDLVTLIEQKVPAGTASDGDFANIDDVLDQSGGSVDEAIRKMKASVKEELAEANEDLHATLSSMTTIGYVIFVIVVIVLAPAFYLFSRSIVGPLQKTVGRTRELDN